MSRRGCVDFLLDASPSLVGGLTTCSFLDPLVYALVPGLHTILRKVRLCGDYRALPEAAIPNGTPYRYS